MKILKITSVLILSVVILLLTLSLILENRVAALVLKSLNRNFSTKIETKSYNLSLLKKFPRASVELKNVLVHSSPDFDRRCFGMTDTDTLVSAKSASLDFKMIDLLKGEYTFEKITVRSGRLNFYTDTAGNYNYNVTSKTGSGSGSTPFSLNLNRINLSDMKVFYNDLNVRLVIKGIIKNGRVKSRITEKEIDFEGNSDVTFDLFSLRGNSVRQPVEARLAVSLIKNNKGYFFRKSTMQIENWDFDLTGFISSDNYVDLKVTGNNIDISRITNYIPDKFKEQASEYHPSGTLKLDYKVKGKSSRTVDPHYDLSYSLKNARISHNRSSLKLDKFSFNGSYSNGNKNRPETSSVTINNFAARLGSAIYTGSFNLTDFKRPEASLIFKGKVYPVELKKFFNLKKIDRTEGSLDLDIKLSGYLDKKDTFRLSNILDLGSHSVITFNSFGIKLADKPVDLRNVTGEIFINETAVADKFGFVFDGQKFTISCNLKNLPGWLAGNPVNLMGSASLNAPCLKPELFRSRPLKPDEGKVKKAPVILTDNVIIDVDFNIDTLSYKTFNASKIRGILSIKPKILNFRTISLNSQKGKVTGNGLVVQNAGKSFIARGSFTVSGVDVNEAFTTFHNFGQGFLKAENIAGSLSGTLTLILPVDSLLTPEMKSLTAEGKYLLTNGALIDFDPVKALSTFIELSELKNITFEKLENEFFIKNNFFYVPQMEVKSSAVDLSVNGKHNFDNSYQYHVKLLLSEILSNKARKNKTLSSEFGEVDDDGLGRTSVFLKVEGKGEDVRVSYDMKAAGTQVRNDIKKEKQNLKNILNEEYGWFNKDTSAVNKPAPKKRFRVSWEESDSIPAEKEPAPKKESLLKKLFKKK